MGRTHCCTIQLFKVLFGVEKALKIVKTLLLPRQNKKRIVFCQFALLVVFSCFYLFYVKKQENLSFQNYERLPEKNFVVVQFNKTEQSNTLRSMFCLCNSSNAPLLPQVNQNLSCIAKSVAIKRSVLCEVASQFTTLSKFCSIGNLDWSCMPKLINITCDKLRESSLPCSKAFVIEQFDYHTQFHCLYRIAQLLQPQNEALKVPRLHHQVWFYGPNSKLEFYVYLGLVSHLRFFRPEALFLWNSGNLPTGRWWQEMISTLNQNVSVVSVTEKLTFDNSHLVVNRTVYTSQVKVYSVVRQPPSAIYSNEINQVQHKSDITRLESALLFGGFYADIDTLSLKPLDPLLRYSLTMGRERHDGVGNMMIFAQPFTAYLFLWHASYYNMQKTEWVAHSIDGNHKLGVQCPKLINVEQSSLLTPNFINRHKFTWQNLSLPDSYMVHAYWRWRHVELSAYHNPEGIAFSKTLLGRLYRAIYYGLSSTSG